MEIEMLSPTALLLLCWSPQRLLLWWLSPCWYQSRLWFCWFLWLIPQQRWFLLQSKFWHSSERLLDCEVEISSLVLDAIQIWIRWLWHITVCSSVYNEKRLGILHDEGLEFRNNDFEWLFATTENLFSDVAIIPRYTLYTYKNIAITIFYASL